jgi:hypothetical protein
VIGVRALIVAAVAAASVVPTVHGQASTTPDDTACTIVEEPNDQPVDAIALPTAAACATAEHADGGQDLYAWTVSEADAASTWTISTDGVPGQTTVLQVYRVELDADGNVADFAALASTDAEPGDRASIDGLLWPADTYYVAVGSAGAGPYRLDIGRTDVVAQPEVEPNDAPGQETAVAGEFTARGVNDGTVDRYTWELDEADAERTWQLDLTVPVVGEGATLQLLGPDGGRLVDVSTDATGRASVPDLQLPAGRYTLTATQVGDGGSYILAAAPIEALIRPDDAVPEREPNDLPERPQPIVLAADGAAVSGRLASRRAGDSTDWFTFDVGVDVAGRLLDVKLLWTGDVGRTLCLSDAASDVLCGTGEGRVIFNDLVLPAGGYRLRVTGPPDPGAPYILRIDVTTEAPSGFESEPNETREFASPMDAVGEQAIGNGRLAAADTGRGDVDVFEFEALGEPQLWELTVAGPGVARIDALDVLGGSTVFGLATDGTATLYDLFLLPGEHAIAVSGAGGEYTVEATPLGPPDPRGEHEPNGTFDQSQRLVLGETYSGRPRPAGDIDTWRFSLQNDQLVRFNVAPPAGTTLRLRVESAGSFVDNSTTSPGATLAHDVLLPQGDYTLVVESSDASDQPYSLSIEALDPYTTPTQVGDPPPAADLDLSFDGCDQPVAAFVTETQHLRCTLAVANGGDDATTIELDGTTGNRAWAIEFGEPRITLQPGGTTSTGVTVVVAPDAWAGHPVLVTVRARTGDAVATASTSVVPDGTVVPVDPAPAPPPLPPELLGGLDVAWSALGATITAVPSNGGEARLIDQLVSVGQGVHLPLGVDAAVVVDLAGEETVPVAGFTLTPELNLGAVSRLASFAVDVSVDGTAFTEVLVGELTHEQVEQAFVLDDPVDARVVRVRPLSAHGPAPTATAALGGLAVVAQPGWRPADVAAGADIAALALGGHLVTIDPPVAGPGDVAMLTPEDRRQIWFAVPGDTLTWTLGFHHDRVAQITSFSWLDPPGSDPAARLDEVELEVSTTSPLGPWEHVATWTLDRSTGDPAFELDAPVWARFVRFRATVPGDVVPGATPTNWELPDAVRVVERPVDDEYRSILGAWGGATRASGYELANPADPVELNPDAGDTADAAADLPLGTNVTDSAWVGADEDWYRITIPDGETAIAVTSTGSPTVGVDVEIRDATGATIETAVDETPRETTYTAEVASGAEYFVRVTEPPTSVVFAYDTSVSTAPFVATVYAGLNRYAAGIEEGRETVNIVPFGREPLLDAPTDEGYLVQTVITNYGRGSDSSNAEAALSAAMDELAGSRGVRAIVLITDAQSHNTPDEAAQMWSDFAAVDPRVYALHIVGGTPLDQDLMEDWAAVNAGGEYRYIATQADMDVAFDRALTVLRRPSVYTLRFEVTDPPRPGLLRVPALSAAADGAVDSAVSGLASAPNVAIVLDTSGSMLQPVPTGGRRIDVARAALTSLVTGTLAPGTNVSLRVFGTTPDSCETTLLVPQAPLDPAAMSATIAGVPVVDGVRTPIGASLGAVAGDFANVTGPQLVVFVSDGEETCGGDPAAAITALRASGVDVRVNIVGFALDDAALEAQFEEWAALGGGQYFDATDQATLTAAIASAVQPSFEVRDRTGVVVATGQAGGPPVELPAGSYTVVLHTAVPTELPAEVVGGETVVLGVPSS